jgi:hypothetical protein
MKLNWVGPPTLFTLALLATLPLAFTSAIPSPHLHKRLYGRDYVTTRKAYYRINISIAPVVHTCEEGSTIALIDGIFLWPLGETRGSGLHVCSAYDHCPEGRFGRTESREVCPNGEVEWVDKLVAEGAAGKWDPAIDRNEAYRAMHAVDPVNFPHADWDAKVAADNKPAEPKFLSLLQAQRLGAFGVPAPGPVQNGVEMNCKKWHQAAAGDSCYWIAENNGIALQQFYDWNKEVNNGGQCVSLWIGYSYCVGT